MCEEKTNQAAAADPSAETAPAFDITDFNQGPAEIIKYMDYMPEDDEKRMAMLISFMRKCCL